MSRNLDRELKLGGKEYRVGASNTRVRVLERDHSGDIARSSGATVPTSGDSGYSVGADFFSTSTGKHYVNEGSKTSASFVQSPASGTEALTASGVVSVTENSTSLDSSGGALTMSLASGPYIGFLKTIVMTEASNSSTVSITNHETSDPEVATFNAVDEYLLLVWTGTEWATVSGTATFV